MMRESVNVERDALILWVHQTVQANKRARYTGRLRRVHNVLFAVLLVACLASLHATGRT